MVTVNTVHVDGLVVRTGWDSRFIGPVELLVTLDTSNTPYGRGISAERVRHLNFHSMSPDTLKVAGTLRGIGDWLERNCPGFRQRPEDSNVFYAHVALFYSLAVQEGERGVTRTLGNYAGVRPTMARRWIEQARRSGMLTECSSGSVGGMAYGQLTDKARAWLTSQSVSPVKEAA